MPPPAGQGIVENLDRGAVGAGVHRRAAIRRGMMLAGRGALAGRLVVVFMPFHRFRLSRNGKLALTVAWTGNLARPQQLWDQDKSGGNAGGAAIEHDRV